MPQIRVDNEVVDVPENPAGARDHFNIRGGIAPARYCVIAQVSTLPFVAHRVQQIKRLATTVSWCRLPRWVRMWPYSRVRVVRCAEGIIDGSSQAPG